MVLNKLLTSIFKKRLEDTISNDSELKQLLKEGDLILTGMKKEVLEAMIAGREVPSYAMRYVNLKSLSSDEKRFLKIKIVEAILNNQCPENRIVELTDFNSEHPLWEKYLSLKASSDLQKEKVAQRIKKNKAMQAKAQDKEVELLIAKYGKDNYKKAISGELFEDMDEFLLVIAKGQPDKKETNLIKGKGTAVWYYGKYITRLNTEAYKLSVRLLEGKVKGWQHL